MDQPLESPWIVIPARGGSTGVPRKNVRLLGGVPLIARTIKTALSGTLAGRVVVITDDDEIAEISERFGAVVTREEKTTGKATLDEVMVRTIPFLRSLGAQDNDVLLTTQPTCPFIKPERVKEAMGKFAEGAGSVLTVVDDRHLEWVFDAEGKPSPAYTARVNRQLLPPKFRESGAIIGARIGDIVRTGTRIVPPINLVEVPDGESLDIDTFSDWAIAEHIVSRKRILLRTDAAKELGMGHVYRTLALAYALARHDITIVLSEDKPLGAEFFKDYPFKVDTVKSDLEFLSYARKAKAELVVLDRLDNLAEFVTLLGGFCKVVTFEDLGDGAEAADLLIADLYENPRVPAERQLTGVENAILAPTFETIDRQIQFREKVQEVLVLFGGTDPSNLAETALRALEHIKFEGRVTIVRGLGADLIDPKAFDLRLKVLSNIKNMPAVMENADIALSSAGRTITELSSLGIPTICMAQNSKELTHTHTTPANGVIMLGLGKLVSVETLGAHLTELMENTELREKLHLRALEATKGRSNANIVRRIMKQIGF
jgi:CMP-N-acetylneuraminic acid synthetase/spore coat polysaccharide biosynthesis predicted glycosyltransferase SpsG